ncbi:hypothetical protein CMO91_02250 [Candidatus Woesearchaeota archaeon]|nr:hypothetical protein [Candidatus Woesearchaeota archaeon]|tara:strand:- start:1255 stop:1563 length:309 start_codon:yes stop_codon:yes gene_type:complete
MIALVLVRGTNHARPEVQKTVQHLGLKKNNAKYLEDKHKGAILRLLNYATWGTVTEKIKANQPPRGGYGGIKTLFKHGGALGDRGDKMGDLLKRMSDGSKKA